MDGKTINEIMAWAVPVATAVLGGMIIWLRYLTIMTYQNKQSIAVNSAMDEVVATELNKMDRKMDTIRDDMIKWIEKMENKMEKGFESVRREIRKG